MRWQELLQQGHIDIDGHRYGLEHLLGGIIQIEIPAKERYPAVCANIAVEYTSHCVTYGPGVNTPPFDFEILGPARRVFDHRGVVRVFCFDRHRWSLHLPGVIAQFDRHMCFFTGRENWMVVELIDDEGRRAEYEIFFRLRRGDEPSTLRLVVESAYVRDPGRGGPGIPKNRRGRVRFAMLVAKTLRGEPIRDSGGNR